MAACWLAVVVAVLSGCVASEPDLPTVRVVRWPGQPLLETYVAGVSAWDEIGFETIGDEVGELAPDECERRWYETGNYDCTITIGIKREPHVVERFGTEAYSDRAGRFMVIDERVTEQLELTIAVAHEAGHILLDTAEHTQGGVMGGASAVVEAVDRELACRSIGVC